MLITTIIARNYLPQARVLARSFLDHHPGGRVVALVLDAPGEGWRDDEPFEVLTPDQLPIDRPELHRMATIYDVMELATALKPTLLRYLVVDRGEPSATYLDPDIQVFAPLDDIAALARAHGVVLTPHRLEPMPEDGRGPVEQVLVQSGAYNLGFVAVSAAAAPFLDWWAGRCRRDCVRSFPDGLFVDQRWVDLAVTYFPHHVLRDPGCNVAYWNVDTRPISRSGDGGWAAGGAPLRFFHFSAFDPDRPHLLSHHQGGRPRTLLSEHPALRELCRGYAARLEAEGRAECRKLGYGLDEAADGSRIDLVMRRLVREELLRREREPERFGDPGDVPDPFDPDGAARFVALLRSPAPGTPWPRVSRYLEALYLSRPDLQRSFPDLSGLGGNHFLWWLRERGHAQVGLPPEMVPSAGDLLPDPAPAAPRRASDVVGEQPLPTQEWREAGVRVVGYVGADLGVGEAARGLVAALRSIDEPVWVVDERETANRQGHRDPVAPAWPAGAGGGDGVGGDGGDGGGGEVADLDLLCVNADRLPVVLDRLGEHPARRRHTIGMWAWELEEFPAAWCPAADLVDEIWTLSGHAARAIARATGRPVHVVVPPVVAPPPGPEPGERRPIREVLGLPEGFLFLFCFDFFSVAERKNPMGTIEAFCRAFRPGEGPQLVIKTINGSAVLTELERLRVRAAERPDVHVVDGYLDPGDQRALLAAGDAYVSLHRAEGLGYTMAEAMLAGRPVIATGYSGNLEFMDRDNSFLVGYGMTTVPEGCDPYPAGAAWADPDLDEAAAAMRQVVADPDHARAVAERGLRTIRERHLPAARGPLLAARLAASRALAAERRATARRRALPPSLAARTGRRLARQLTRVAAPNLAGRVSR